MAEFCKIIFVWIQKQHLIKNKSWSIISLTFPYCWYIRSAIHYVGVCVVWCSRQLEHSRIPVAPPTLTSRGVCSEWVYYMFRVSVLLSTSVLVRWYYCVLSHRPLIQPWCRPRANHNHRWPLLCALYHSVDHFVPLCTTTAICRQVCYTCARYTWFVSCVPGTPGMRHMYHFTPLSISWP